MDIERKVAEMKRKAEELADEAADLHGFAPRNSDAGDSSASKAEHPNPEA